MVDSTKKTSKVTIGLDLGDKYSYLKVLDSKGDVIEEGRIRTNPEDFRRRFAGTKPAIVALETGTHSPWAFRVIEECGHEVIVANSRQVPLISQNNQKSDDHDPELLGRLARVDPKLLKAYDNLFVKKAGKVDESDRRVVGGVFVAMAVLWVSWFAMCPQDPLRAPLLAAVRWSGLGLVVSHQTVSRRQRGGILVQRAVGVRRHNGIVTDTAASAQGPTPRSRASSSASACASPGPPAASPAAPSSASPRPRARSSAR